MVFLQARMSLLRALAAVWRVGEEQVQLYTALRKPSLHTSQTEAPLEEQRCRCSPSTPSNLA